MPIIFLVNKSEPLEKGIYSEFAKRFRRLVEAGGLCGKGESIEFPVGSNKSEKFDGIYTDNFYQQDAKIKYSFFKNPMEEGFFIRMEYAFKHDNRDNKETTSFHADRIHEIKKRASYFYIPKVSHFELSFVLDDEDYKMYMDIGVSAEDEETLLQVCYSLINQVISMHCMDD